MPTSDKEHKQLMREWFGELKPSTVCDIGIGEGTYSDLLRADCDAKWIGVEAFYPYIKEFNLTSKYDHVIVSDFRHFGFDTVADSVELMIIGDCLEHVDFDEALRFIDRAKKWARNIFVSIPLGHCPQDAVGGNEFECHRHDWSYEDGFIALGDGVKEAKKGDILAVYWWSKDEANRSLPLS